MEHLGPRGCSDRQEGRKLALGILLSSASYLQDSGSNKFPLRERRGRLSRAEVPHSRSLHPDHVHMRAQSKQISFPLRRTPSAWSRSLFSTSPWTPSTHIHTKHLLPVLADHCTLCPLMRSCGVDYTKTAISLSLYDKSTTCFSCTGVHCTHLRFSACSKSI